MTPETIDLNDLPEIPADLFEKAKERREFWWAHYDEYRERYPDQFVAVKDGKVIAAASDLTDFNDLLRAAGLNVCDDVDTEFIRSEPMNLIL